MRARRAFVAHASGATPALGGTRATDATMNRMPCELCRCDAACPPASELVAGAFAYGVATCGGVIKDLGYGYGAVKRMYVAPPFCGRGSARALLGALESIAGYREVADYDDNPHADVWGEERL